MATKFPITSTEETIEVQLEVGTHELELTVEDNAGNKSVPAPITVVVVGLPKVESFSPASGSTGQDVTITGHNFFDVQSVSFYDDVEAEIVNWSRHSISVRVPDGAVDGPIRVRTRHGSDTSAQHFTVVAEDEIQVSISPQAPNIMVNRKVRFTADVTGTDNTDVTWTAGTGTITPDGRYTAPPNPGSDTVTATSVADPDKSAEAIVTVREIVVSIEPTVVTLFPTQGKAFNFTVEGAPPFVNWTATGGTVDERGFYRAGSTLGDFEVTVTSRVDDTKSATANVKIVAGTEVAVSVDPSSATLGRGARQQFTATVEGTTNKRVKWTATGGTIDDNGLYTARRGYGSFKVVATSEADSTKSATATVRIVPVLAVAVSVAPSSATLGQGARQRFTATVEGTTNKRVKWTATGGGIDGNGLYHAGRASGNFEVVATSEADRTKSATARVTVVVGKQVQVSVTPTSVRLKPGQTQQFKATVTGILYTATTGPKWTATGGRIDPKGKYTAGTRPGTYEVTVTAAPGHSATARVTVLEAVVTQPVEVSVTPTSVRLKPGQTQQFKATVTGIVYTATTGPKWTATGGRIDPKGKYTAGTRTGNYSVTVTATREHSATATVLILLSRLTAVRGLGTAYEERLETAGITNLKQLARAKPARVAEVLGVSEQKAKGFITEAGRLARP